MTRTAGAAVASLIFLSFAVNIHAQTTAPRSPLTVVSEENALKAKTVEITKKIGALASSGTLPASDDSIALLRQLVDELTEIRARLSALESDNAAIKKKQASAAPSKTSVAGFSQFQYKDSSQPGALADAFQFRRARIIVNHQSDDHVSARLSADFATGANQTSAQLKDGYVQYVNGTPTGTPYQVLVGQFTVPLEYQLIRADIEREFPERTPSMASLFNGERSRGIMAKAPITGNLVATGAVMDALTINDPEQVNIAAGPGGKLAAEGGLRYGRPGLDAGISGFLGKRSQFTAGAATSPETDRKFIFADVNASHIGTTPLSVRAEYMAGKDRVPSAAAAATSVGENMNAWNLELGYKPSLSDGIFARYERWNRNTGAAGSNLKTTGLAYVHDFSPNLRLSGAYEWFSDDKPAQGNYHITTLRVQYRF